MDCRLVILVLCVGFRAPNSDASQVTTTSVGKDVTLRCQISDLDSHLRYLFWRKDGETVYYSGSNSWENADGKYSVIDKTSLVISDVDGEDAGNFSCKVVRQSLSTEESDMIQLLVIDLSVSNCKDTRQDVDGCSCYIDGANITSLECSATGFPNSVVITWDESEITYLSSSVDLTRYNKNLTLACKAHDRNLQSVVANKTVCVHYTRGVKPNGPTGETPVAPVRNEALVAAIIMGTLLAFVCLALLIQGLIYRRKMGKDLCLRTRFFWTSSVTLPKTSCEPTKTTLRGMSSSGYGGEMVDVFKDSFKISEASSAPDISKLDGIEVVDKDRVDYFTKDCNEDVPKTSREPSKRTLSGMNSSGYCSETVDVFKDSFKISEASSVPDIRTVDPDHFHYFPKDCNEDFMVDDEPLPLVGQVLLDDLKSSTEEDKESMKAVILALLEKRIEPYKMHQAHVDPFVTVKTSSSDLNETMQRSMMIDKFSDPDASFVYMVLQDLDQILDERDRDECEILITKPGFQEVTDESEIPAYQGDRVPIHQSLRMHQVKSSQMNDSMVARIPLSSVLRKEMLKKPSERNTIRNDISQIILDFMKKGHSGLRTSNNLKYSTSMPMDTNVDGEVFRLVAFWTSKIVKLDNDVNNHIRKYLFPLKRRITNKCPDADPQIARLQEEEEEEEIPETPSSAKLLEESIQR